MGKKYMIKVVKDTDEVLPELHHGSIVELEELPKDKNDSLVDQILKGVGYSHIWQSRQSAYIAENYFRGHPEELGLVRIEDVLKVFDNKMREAGCNPNSAWFCGVRQSIEGMKGAWK